MLKTQYMLITQRLSQNREHARAGRRRPRFLVNEGVFPQNSSELNEKVQQQHESSVKVMPPIKKSGKNSEGKKGPPTTKLQILNVSTWRPQTSTEPAEAVEREDDQPDHSDIHVTLTDLLKSMNKLYNEVAELKASFKLQESELRTAKDSLNAALKHNDELKLELKATKQRVKEQEEEIYEFYENMDTFEQYTRKNSL